MAINKNAMLRYRVLDKCFSNGSRRYYIQDLITACINALQDHYGNQVSISRRQIFEDMRFMRSDAGYQAEILSIKDGRKVYYQYEDLNFSIDKKPLTPKELDNLETTVSFLSHLANIAGLQTVVAKLLDVKQGGNPRAIISFEENQYLEGLDYLTVLFNYIKNKQNLVIEYKPFKSEVANKEVISPYYLKQYNKRWFLFAFNHQINRVHNYPLDRIVDIQAHSSEYIENEIDMEEYFEDIIGVTNYDHRVVQQVHIELSESVLPYIKSKPIHPSQKLRGNILVIEVKQNYELESLILSHGQDMKVLKPDSLRESIEQKVLQTYELYNNLNNE